LHLYAVGNLLPNGRSNVKESSGSQIAYLVVGGNNGLQSGKAIGIRNA